jgi:hypothetical protein
MSNPVQLLTESLASFRARVANLESKLSVQILYGSGHMVLATKGDLTLVLGRFSHPGHYDANAPRVFCSLDITPDHLCGVCLYPIEDATENARRASLNPEMAGYHFTTRHIRAEQERRLALSRDMVSFLETALAKLTA